MLDNLINSIAETGLVPDTIVRAGIRRALKQRLQEIYTIADGDSDKAREQFISAMNSSPIAQSPEKANEQHYELPAKFFALTLGEQGKYSCSYWPKDCQSLDEAEVAALFKTCQHADLQDGQSVLELGCGWGSLSLYMAERYPNSQITSVSNSYSQADYIRGQIDALNLQNLTIVTADMNDFTTAQHFDRIVSVEMFEHMRNWPQLFSRVATWLRPDGAFFMHVFTHKLVPYFYEDRGESDWMSRHFFAGGIMPSLDLPKAINKDLVLQQRWVWEGHHYEKTSNAWLRKMDSNKAEIMPLLENCYGKQNAKKWWVRWRIFYMACAELFGYHDGSEWFVAHYRFERAGLPMS